MKWFTKRGFMPFFQRKKDIPIQEQQMLVIEPNNKDEVLKQKQIELHYHENALKLLLKYRIDDISCIVDKGHEIFIIKKEIETLMQINDDESSHALDFASIQSSIN